jgi:hypothetical protein
MFHTKVVQKIKTHNLCSVTFFSKNHTVCELIWENIEERGGGGDRDGNMAIWRMCIACCIAKATNSHSECVTLIIFPPNNEACTDPSHKTLSVLLPVNRRPFMQNTQPYNKGYGGRSLSLCIHFRGKQC